MTREPERLRLPVQELTWRRLAASRRRCGQMLGTRRHAGGAHGLRGHERRRKNEHLRRAIADEDL